MRETSAVITAAQPTQETLSPFGIRLSRGVTGGVWLSSPTLPLAKGSGFILRGLESADVMSSFLPRFLVLLEEEMKWMLSFLLLWLLFLPSRLHQNSTDSSRCFILSLICGAGIWRGLSWAALAYGGSRMQLGQMSAGAWSSEGLTGRPRSPMSVSGCGCWLLAGSSAGVVNPSAYI